MVLNRTGGVTVLRYERVPSSVGEFYNVLLQGLRIVIHFISIASIVFQKSGMERESFLASDELTNWLFGETSFRRKKWFL